MSHHSSWQYAPIVLFVYNRPLHTQQTLDALEVNQGAEHSEIHIYADGPKEGASEQELENIRKVRELIQVKRNFKNKIVHLRESNGGLADNISQGVSEMFQQFEKLIVLEDDLLSAPFFLTYMNQALQTYEKNPEVMHISGFMFPANLPSLTDTFFYNVASCWGWATWRRAWQHFNPDAQALKHEIDQKGLEKAFTYQGSRDFYQQLEQNIRGSLKTWAIKWHTSVFLRGGLCLHPRQSLVNNIGFDGTGENCPSQNPFFHPKLAEKISVEPLPLFERTDTRKHMVHYFQEMAKTDQNRSLVSSFINKGKAFLQKYNLVK